MHGGTRGYFPTRIPAKFIIGKLMGNALTNLLSSHLKLLMPRALEYSGQKNISKNNSGIILGGSQDSSVGMATDCSQDGRDSILSRTKEFSVLHSLQTGTGAHPVSYPMSTGTYFPGGNAAGT
jgi:hypothetical protein